MFKKIYTVISSTWTYEHLYSPKLTICSVSTKFATSPSLSEPRTLNLY